MSGEENNQTNNTPQEILQKAIDALRSAEIFLSQASDETVDKEISKQIRAEYNFLDALMTQIGQVQAITDDALFRKETGKLKEQAASLQAKEDKIKSLVNNVHIAAQIVGYIAQAAAFIAKLT
jgi:hypothetical protein